MSEDTAIAIATTTEVEADEHWTIDGPSSLNWALERMSEQQAQIDENDALAKEAVERIRARLEECNAPARRSLAYFEGQIKLYAESHRGELIGGGKKKSRALPAGTIGWRKSGGKIVIMDEAACLAWARQQPIEADLVRVKVEPNKTAINDWFKANGEVPPGCELEPEAEAIYIKPEPLALNLGTPAPALKP